MSLPHIVIIGGGFGGLAAARALGDAPVRITLVDRRNHHLFQPLLYQVATAALNASDIARPIRRILRRQANCEVILGEAESIDRFVRKVILGDGEIGYDYLIIASGATHSYFGHDAWERDAPGLKTLEEALDGRRSRTACWGRPHTRVACRPGPAGLPWLCPVCLVLKSLGKGTQKG